MVNSKQWKAWLYLAPALVLLMVFTVWPIINTVRMSLLENYSGLKAAGGATFNLGFGNFVKVVKYKRFVSCLKNTVLLCLWTVPISTLLALLIALAMILSYLESLVPPFVAIPGIKVGLANIAVVFALYRMGWKEAVGISLVRVLCVSLLFGSGASFLYSVAGAALSMTGMLLLKRTGLFSQVAVSVAGGVLHNIGQIIMASILLATDVLRYYLPFLLLGGIVAGVVVGVAATVLIRRIHGLDA